MENQDFGSGSYWFRFPWPSGPESVFGIPIEALKSRIPVTVPGPIDGGVEDNDNNHEVEEDANPLRVVDQPQTQEIKEDNTTLNIRSANNPLRVVDPGQP